MKETRPLSPEETELFNSYYKGNYAMIYRVALTLVRDENIAEVVTQETFVTAWEKFDQFQEKENPIGWLVLVARNKSKQAIEQKKRYMEMRLFGRKVEELAVEYDYDQYELLIPDCAEKRLMIRYYEEGYRIQELADEQGIKLSAMKMRIKRAKERLRNEYLKNNQNKCDFSERKRDI